MLENDAMTSDILYYSSLVGNREHLSIKSHVIILVRDLLSMHLMRKGVLITELCNL